MTFYLMTSTKRMFHIEKEVVHIEIVSLFLKSGCDGR